ncbi:MAG: 1-phosphofructokinase, partial [Phycisphaerae bacterium]|nr:1-phosphofructokinase [Phycisphaerae bacterium]
MDTSPPAIVTITLNPAIDRAIRVQNLRPGGHVTGRTVSRVAGGKGVNVSRVLAAMGLGSTAMGLLGRDNASAFTDVFAGGAVRDGFLRVAGSTRDNVTVIDDATGQDTHIRDAGLAPGPAAVQELIEQIGA